MTRKKFFKTAAYWILLNAGTLLLAAGVYFFKAPNNFATGGVSGISIILAKFIPLPQSWLLTIINVIMLVIGFIFLGKGCTVKTIYCSIVYSLESMLFDLIPASKPLTDQIFLELVYAMLLTGVGSAIIFNCNASSGGTDIAALILKKFTHINVGRALLLTDFLIAASSFFVFDVQTGLFSMLGLFAKAFIVDGVIEDIGKSKYLTIITSEPTRISEYILKQMNRDYTVYDAEGGYTGNKKKVLIVMCNRAEARKLRIAAKTFDPQAFVIVTDATEIMGKGFRDPG